MHGGVESTCLLPRRCVAHRQHGSSLTEDRRRSRVPGGSRARRGRQSMTIVRRWRAWMIAAGCCIVGAMPVSAACTKDRCRILVAGDMGIGDDAFAAGFAAVQGAMAKDAPDLVLYAGDYIYTRQTCEWQAPPEGLPPYVAEVRDKLVAPFGGRVVFAAGDNDLPG